MAITRGHIGPNGPDKCNATKGKCPYAAESNHFSSLEEAEAVYAERMGSIMAPALKSSKKRLTPEERELREKKLELARKLVEDRSQTGGITFDDANPERAKRRLDEAIGYAKERGNTHLVAKLSNAAVLASGSFKTAEGVRVNTDALLKNYLSVKDVERNRDAAAAALAKRAEELGVKPGEKFSLKTEAGSFTMTVAEGFNEAAFDALPENVKKTISSPRKSYSIEEARKHLPAELVEQISSETQVIEYVVGKRPELGNPELLLRRSNSMEDGLADVAAYYGKVHETSGKVRDMNALVKEQANAVKATAGTKSGNVFAPARSQMNGALVSGRRNLSPKLVDELLTDTQKARIATEVMAPDSEKARGMLSEEEFQKIFRATKVSFRVTEAK